jgi:hypothetical protein
VTRPFPPEDTRRALARIMAGITRPRNLNRRRRDRTYPRVVKRARHNAYRVKKPSDKGTRHHGPPTIKLTTPVKLQLAA